jgi:hypothetical protein
LNSASSTATKNIKKLWPQTQPLLSSKPQGSGV